MLLAVGVVGTIGDSLLAGRLAQDPTSGALWALAVCAVGAALCDTAGRFVWVTVVDRAAGRLRDDLVDAVLAQPLQALSEQAVGEILDRVDDDTHEITTLLRVQIWVGLRTVVAAVPMWIVAGVQWWPAWVLFPVFATLTWLLMRTLLPAITARKVKEEQAWTDHAAALEEGIAGRDDLRTSRGQPFMIRRLAQRSSDVHQRFRAVVTLEGAILMRTGVALHALLAVIVLAGALLTPQSQLSVGALVTVFVMTSTFVNLAARFAEQLPDIQAGMGAVVRLRQVLRSPVEPTAGVELPAGPLSVEFRDVRFGYTPESDVLHGVSAHLEAGRTLALVGRTGSGKSTLASLLSRAVEPNPGQVFVGGVDVTNVRLGALRSQIGVVTQRTEILSGTLAENISLFAPIPDDRVTSIVAELGLADWVASLPAGIHTRLGAGGMTLSAGEEQLIAFARLLARDVRVVVLDEATARMDPVTEARVVTASERLLRNRTGILIAHRLTTIERADDVMVLADGRVIEYGSYRDVAAGSGPFRAMLDAAGSYAASDDAEQASGSSNASDQLDASESDRGAVSTASARRMERADTSDLQERASLARAVWDAINVRREWGMFSAVLFLMLSLSGTAGALTGFAWGHTVQALKDGDDARGWALLTAVFILTGPLMLAAAVRRFPRWWIEVLLRIRLNVLIGQTDDHLRRRAPAGEVVARAMDADRLVRYTDRWIDVVNGIIIVVVTTLIAHSLLAGLLLLSIVLTSALASVGGRGLAGKAAARASATRADFGRALVSAVESIRTVKLAARTSHIRDHLRSVDSGRVDAAVREHRVAAVLEGVPLVMVNLGVVIAWWGVYTGRWSVATGLLIASASMGFEWFGRVAGAVVTEAPGTRAWVHATSEFATPGSLTRIPQNVDLCSGEAPAPDVPQRAPLRQLELVDFSVVYPDGTVGVTDVTLSVRPGELVLLVGPVGSGKSSVLAACAGLVPHRGQLVWNGETVTSPMTFLRPGNVAYVGQTPRVFSGSLAENIGLDHDRDVRHAIAGAQLHHDVDVIGGHDALVGHRGVRLSGGQVQRLALARALAADPEVLLADDVSSALDAATENDLWRTLRNRGTTVIGATAKRAALEQADQVLILDGGRVVDQGSWSDLAGRWGHVAG